MSIKIETYDVVIVGAGLAGCAAARECQKAGKNSDADKASSAKKPLRRSARRY